MISSLVAAYNQLALRLTGAGRLWLTGLVARFVFFATLFSYYLHSAGTKVGDGLFGLFDIQAGAYAQIVPRIAEEAQYDPSAIPLLWKLFVYIGTYAEFALPVLVVAGLLTRLSAVGMLIFILVQSYVDMAFHGVTSEVAGQWFDRLVDGAIFEQRLFWSFPLLYLVIHGPGLVSAESMLGKLIGRRFLSVGMPCQAPNASAL